MTVRDIINELPERNTWPPDSLFEIKNPHTGETHIRCYVNFKYARTLIKVLDSNPDILSWEVTKPHFTRDEVDEIKKAREAKEDGKAQAS